VAASVFSYLVLDNADHIAKPVKNDTATNSKTVIDNLQTDNNPSNNITLSNESGATAKVIPINSRKKETPADIIGMLLPTVQQQKENEELLAANNLTNSVFTPTIVDEYTPYKEDVATKEETKLLANDDNERLLSIESVVNSYRPKSRKHRSEFQIIFTPTISYRKLSENKSYLRSVPAFNATQSNAALYNINNMVTHKPDMGLELGFALKYPIAKAVKLRTGIQFNMSRYDIKAFNNPLEIATIALNNRSRVDSVNTVSNLRNFGGTKQDWLQNLYFQVSAPVGVEVKLRGDDKMQFGIASTIQPTYVLGDRAYLISSDYKNYTQVPWLMRRWNVNTSLETFVAYSTGKLKWQVGPQVRYQLLSSFVTKYPVKENLFDFGLKVGVSVNKPK
jgi:hypothetical protein